MTSREKPEVRPRGKPDQRGRVWIYMKPKGSWRRMEARHLQLTRGEACAVLIWERDHRKVGLEEGRPVSRLL